MTSGTTHIESLTGWGRTAPTTAEVAAPDTPAAVVDLIGRAGPRGILARGGGNSYGDAAQNAGGLVVRMTGLNRVHHADLTNGLAEVDAGITLGTLMRLVVPLGLFPHAMPGTQHVTVGGAIAADVHGKDHHEDGSFANHITHLTLHTPQGVIQASPHDNAEAFWATAGGMGLTGVVTSATVRLRTIPSAFIRQDTDRCADLDDLLRRMEDDSHHHYGAAWIDGHATGRSLGRSILTRGTWATPDELSPTDRWDPSRHQARSITRVPSGCPDLLRSPAVAAFNAVRYHKTSPGTRHAVVPLEAFFHPLDSIAGWNQLYGRGGLVQYQFAVPAGSDGERALLRALELAATSSCPPVLVVLKRLGHGNGYLSFPRRGWTIAMDFPAANRHVASLLDHLDEVILAAGGRLYLAKDSRARPETIAAMYPQLAAWREVRDTLDPNGVLTSDLSRRLRLCDPTGRRSPSLRRAG